VKLQVGQVYRLRNGNIMNVMMRLSSGKRKRYDFGPVEHKFACVVQEGKSQKLYDYNEDGSFMPTRVESPMDVIATAN
jgi:hypothetical protein